MYFVVLCIIPKKKYNKQHIIPLEAVKLENLEDEGVVKNGWLIRTPTKSFAVYAATATEKTEWMAHINKCVEDLIRKTGKKPSKEHAAVWVPDSEASVCMHCRKSQFTLINRKHHCRKCGAVVCNPCSSKKFLLPTQSSKPLRVCLHCYDTLSKSKYDAQQNEAVSKAVPAMNVKIESSGDEDSDEGDEEEQEKEMIIDDEEEMTKDMEDLHIQEKPTFYQDTDTKQNNVNENAVDNQTTDVPNSEKESLPIKTEQSVADINTSSSNSNPEPTTTDNITSPASESDVSHNDG